MKEMMKLVLAFFFFGMTADLTFAADACAKSTENGGQVSLVGRSNIGITDIFNPSANAWRNAAANIQSTYGSNVAYNSASIQITITFTVLGGYPTVQSYPISYSGSTSIGRAILDHVHVDEGQGDSNPCDPNKNSRNGASTGGGGGGSIWIPGGCIGNCGREGIVEVRPV